MKIFAILIASAIAASSAFASEDSFKEPFSSHADRELFAARMIFNHDVDENRELNAAELENAIESMIAVRVERIKEIRENKAAAKGVEFEGMTFMLPVGEDVASAVMASHDLDGNGLMSLEELKESTVTIRKFNLNPARRGVKRG